MGDDLIIREGGPKSDEELLASLYERAFSTRVPELSHQARVGVVAGCGSSAGIEVLCLLVDRLLVGEEDGPLEGMNILFASRNIAAIAERYRPRVAELAAHKDFAVSVMAHRLGAVWEVSLKDKVSSLPGFYSLVFDNAEVGELYRAPTKLSGNPETVWVNDPLDWTWPLQFQIGLVSDASGISHMHLRQRCAQIINAEGGLERFGPDTEKLVRRRLDRIQMRLTYRRPVMSAAISALRQVVGELMRAERLDPAAVPFLMHELGFPGLGEELLTPSRRPPTIRRPSMDDIGYGKDEDRWVDEIESDFRPTDVGNNNVLLAEVSLFEHRTVGRTSTIIRIRTHGAHVEEWKDLDEALRVLPRVIGYSPPHPIYRQPSLSVVARVDTRGVATAPENLLLICPHWAKRLGWSAHPENPLVYRDGDGTVVVRTIWWRDGGPRDARDDVQRGEGVLVLLTRTGANQMEAVAGPVQLRTTCWRESESQGSDKAPKMKRVSRR